MEMPPPMRAFALPPRGAQTMPLAAPRAGMPLPRAEWPGKPALGKPAAEKAAEAQAAGTRFEAMIIAQLLGQSRPKTSLAGDTPMLAGQDLINQQTDRIRAEAIARSAPLGIGKAIESAAQ